MKGALLAAVTILVFPQVARAGLLDKLHWNLKVGNKTIEDRGSAEKTLIQAIDVCYGAELNPGQSSQDLQSAFDQYTSGRDAALQGNKKVHDSTRIYETELTPAPPRHTLPQWVEHCNALFPRLIAQARTSEEAAVSKMTGDRAGVYRQYGWPTKTEGDFTTDAVIRARFWEYDSNWNEATSAWLCRVTYRFDGDRLVDRQVTGLCQ